MSRKNKKVPVVAVLNMKGGVGKTTISGNLFREVFRVKKVNSLLIDLDAQFNLTQLLMTRAEYDSLLSEKKTIYSVFQHEIPDSVFAVSEDYHLKLPSIDQMVLTLKKTLGGQKLQLLPGDFRLAMLNLKERAELRVPRKRFKLFIENAKDQYDLIVIDCNPSTSFLTGCALEVASNLLVPVKPDKFSVLGVEMVIEYAQIFLGSGLIPDIKIMLNDIGQGEPSQIANDLRAHRILGPMVLVNELFHSDVLRARADYTGFAPDRKVPYKNTVKKNLTDIANEYSRSLGLSS